MVTKITRKKGQTGRASVVQCIQCGAIVPRDKAIEKTRSALPLSYKLRKLLKSKGAYLSIGRRTTYYCVFCAKQRKYV